MQNQYIEKKCVYIQGGAKEITLLEDALIFANGRQCQICFDICGLDRYRIQVNKPWSDTLPKNAE